jgi:IclR family transcriptional regulator, acetate operon repressor
VANFSAASAERCLAIIELLADNPEGMALSAIASRLDLPASATHRLLQVLVARGYVRQDAASDRYVATLFLAALGVRLLAATDIPEVCQPELEALAASTGELVRLSVLEDGHLRWVAKAQGATSSIRYDPISGREVPLHTTAMGKAWLCTLPEAEALKLAKARGLGGDLVGPKAVRSLEALREQLRVTRDRGFGLVEEEAEPGISAVAATIREAGPGIEGPVVGCVSIGGPTFRLDRKRLVSFAPALLETAKRLGRLWPARAYLSREVA